MPAASPRRAVLLLAICQALMMVSQVSLIAEAALVGHMLASDKALATLPVSLQQLMAMCTTIPASLFMRQVGRRWGFTVGACFAIVGTTTATLAILNGSFALFCLGTAINGVYIGFATFYRFAAADAAADEARRSKAISYVIAGGVIAALLGPEMAKLTKDLFAPIPFAGTFAALIILAAVALALLQFIDIPRPSLEERRERGRPLLEIARQPACYVAVLAGMIGYGSMSFVMNATPLSMVACGHAFGSAAFVIQWHALAMFVPSFFTGQIINRFGVLNVILAGAAMIFGCGLVNLAGTEVVNFWLALVLLGLGWNFMFVGATTLLTQSYRPAEKAKVQAANDFLVYGTVSFASLMSGALQHRYGWELVNYAVLPGIVVSALACLWLRLAPKPVSAAPRP